MQALRYLPLVSVVGVDGFAMFLPYLGLVCASAFVYRWLRSQSSLLAAAS